MVKYKYVIISLLLLGNVICIYSQKEDSLKQLLSSLPGDTGKVSELNKVSQNFLTHSNYPLTLQYAMEARRLAESLGFTKGIIKASSIIGQTYYDKGNYPEALRYMLEALRDAQEIKDKRYIADAYNEIGNIYAQMGNSEDEAIKYYKLCLDINKEIDNKQGLAYCYNNIGTIYDYEGKYKEALDYYNEGLKINQAIDNKEEMAINYANIGVVYKEREQYDKALENTFKSIEINEEGNYKAGISAGYLTLGEIYYLQKKYALSQQYYDKALQMAKELGLKDYAREGYVLKAYLDSAMGNYKLLYHDYKTYIMYRDSLINEENTKQAVEVQMNYEFEQKEAAAKAEQDKKDAINQAELQRQKVIRYTFTVGFVLVLGMVGFVYRSYKQKQKANLELEAKNDLIEHQKQEITDSINYARRIQNAILPYKQEIYTELHNCFVLYNPKDIVSGDFYFFKKNRGNYLIAAADCTGHGVPGAFMSMVGSKELQIASDKSSRPSEILKLLNNGVKQTLRQNHVDGTKDGMDIVLCKLEGNTVIYSAANRPLLIVRKDSSHVQEIKATKTAIGGYTPDDQEFEEHTVTLQQGDTIYLCSDGYADQFGGDKHKKLTTKKFKEKLLAIQHLDMHSQEKELAHFMDEWRGGLEQIDDILVIGVRV